MSELPYDKDGKPTAYLIDKLRDELSIYAGEVTDEDILRIHNRSTDLDSICVMPYKIDVQIAKTIAKNTRYEWRTIFMWIQSTKSIDLTIKAMEYADKYQVNFWTGVEAINKKESNGKTD